MSLTWASRTHDEKSMFLIIKRVFVCLDHANACASMCLLVKIHNIYCLPFSTWNIFYSALLGFELGSPTPKGHTPNDFRANTLDWWPAINCYFSVTLNIKNLKIQPSSTFKQVFCLSDCKIWCCWMAFNFVFCLLPQD